MNKSEVSDQINTRDLSITNLSIIDKVDNHVDLLRSALQNARHDMSQRLGIRSLRCFALLRSLWCFALLTIDIIGLRMCLPAARCVTVTSARLNPPNIFVRAITSSSVNNHEVTGTIGNVWPLLDDLSDRHRWRWIVEMLPRSHSLRISLMFPHKFMNWCEGCNVRDLT